MIILHQKTTEMVCVIDDVEINVVVSVYPSKLKSIYATLSCLKCKFFASTDTSPNKLNALM
jgi:hypothetical protein